jgi:hypothetical protein
MKAMRLKIPEYWIVSDVYVRVRHDSNTNTFFATGQTGNPYDLAKVLTQGTVISRAEYIKGIEEIYGVFEGQTRYRD